MPPKDLLERDVALTKLDLALREAQGKGGRTILLRGEAGIGKTSLLRHWTARAAQDDGAQVFWGGCEALFTPRPLGPVMDIAAALGPSVHQALQQHSAPELFASIASWLSMPAAALGSRGGVKRVSMLVVEDAHWADHLTLDFLKYIARRIHQWPALLLISYRDDEVGPMHPLTQVLGDLPAASSEAIDLQPLSLGALSQLSGYDASRTRELFGVTGGNPFFATEIIATSKKDSRDAVPSTVAAAVLARVQRVSAPARRVLEAVSLEPSSMEPAVVVKLVGEGAADAMDECLEAGLLRWQDRGVAFRHELARLAVGNAMSPLRRREWHARIYAQLSKESDDIVDRRAFHARHADDGEAILKTAPAAAERAQTLGAYREAASHLRTALDHAKSATPQQRADLLERWATVAAFINEPLDTQISARHEALTLRQSLNDVARHGFNLGMLAHLHSQAGELDVAWRLQGEAIALLESVPPGAELAYVYGQRAGMHMVANEWAQAKLWGQRAIDLAHAGGLHEAEAGGLNTVGSCMADAGDMQGFALLERSRAIALEHGLHSAAARAWTNGGEASVRLRMLDQGAQWLQEGLDYAHRYDLDRWLPHLSASLAHARVAQGRINEAKGLANRYLPTLPKGIAVSATLRAVAPTVALLEEGPQAAIGLDELWPQVRALRHPDEIVPIALALAESAWMREDLPACREVVEQAVRACAALTAWDWGELACWYHRGGGDPTTLGDAPMSPPSEAELAGDLDTAATLWRDRGMPRHQAWVLTLKPAQDDPNSLAEAIALFDQIGAAACARFARRSARRHATAGLKGIKTGPRAAARNNRFGLTPREQQIASHLAHGRSNADIAARLSRSERTVEHHVATVLTKLGAKRRSDVATLLQGAGELGTILALTSSADGLQSG